jgi:hypothetical protein
MVLPLSPLPASLSFSLSFVSSVGMIPGTIGYVYLGAAAGNAAAGGGNGDAVKIVLSVVGAIAAVVAVGVAAKAAKKELSLVLAAEGQQGTDDGEGHGGGADALPG